LVDKKNELSSLNKNLKMDRQLKKKIFITGSTTGLGFLAGELLKKEGHEVILHARSKNSSMKKEFQYVIGDLSNPDEVKSVAEQANQIGSFDAVIQNAGVYTLGPEELFAVNVTAPYILSTLLHPPERMIYLSSGMHLSGRMNLDLHKCTYSDTKLFVLMIAKWVAELRPGKYINAVDPGWVPTRMGGTGAPDDLLKGAETQTWLATSNDPEAMVTGKYFHHQKQHRYNPIADSEEAQEKLINFIKRILNPS
jgi:NAD(P)-dependent dehydrogenase (short-subunit alcohol dehydrogenase family)